MCFSPTKGAGHGIPLEAFERELEDEDDGMGPISPPQFGVRNNFDKRLSAKWNNGEVPFKKPLPQSPPKTSGTNSMGSNLTLSSPSASGNRKVDKV